MALLKSIIQECCSDKPNRHGLVLLLPPNALLCIMTARPASQLCLVLIAILADGHTKTDTATLASRQVFVPQYFTS